MRYPSKTPTWRRQNTDRFENAVTFGAVACFAVAGALFAVSNLTHYMF